MDLDEVVDPAAHLVAHRPVRRDRGGHRDDAVAGEQARDAPDAADVGVAVLLREAEPLREVLAHLVAVEQLDPVAASRSSSTTMFAMVLLPAPERPVNQRQKPGRSWPRRLRESRATGAIPGSWHESDSRLRYSRRWTRLRSDPRDACGVFGVYAPGQPVAHLTYLGLYALQHRGQESAGIAVSDGETITVVKDMGLVTQVFDERQLAPLEGHLAIGHVRYSTTGSSTWRNAQPVYRSVGDAGFALGHNGNLTNTEELADELGMLPGRPRPSDSELDRRAARPRVRRRAALRRPRPRASRSSRCCRASPAGSRSC